MDHTHTQKKERLEARIPLDIKEIFSQAAALMGCSLTDFIIQSGMKEAKKVIEDQRFLSLSQRDSEYFVQSLMGEEEPALHLKKAALSFKKSISS